MVERTELRRLAARSNDCLLAYSPGPGQKSPMGHGPALLSTTPKVCNRSETCPPSRCRVELPAIIRAVPKPLRIGVDRRGDHAMDLAGYFARILGEMRGFEGHLPSRKPRVPDSLWPAMVSGAAESNRKTTMLTKPREARDWPSQYTWAVSWSSMGSEHSNTGDGGGRRVRI